LLDKLQSAFVVLAVLGSAATFLFLLQRVWPSASRRNQNDLVGWNVTVLGTIYGVMVGFMLFAVWSDFETANANVEAEANCLVNVVRSSRGLPLKERTQILNLSQEYVRLILAKDWAAMSRGEQSSATHPIVRQLWAVLGSSETKTVLEQASLDHTLTELARMTEHRRLRELGVNAHLPGILWLVLILGAVVTIMSACLFGAIDTSAHLLQVLLLALIISSVLVAIADIDRPFQGSVHVEPTSFEQARTSLADIS
jgi:hypothetical protein